MNNEPEPNRSSHQPSAESPMDSPSPVDTTGSGVADAPRPSLGRIVVGVLLGLFGAPTLFLVVAGLIGVDGERYIPLAIASILPMPFIWLWAGWLTGSFARTKGARVGLALLFGLGYGVFSCAAIFALCGGRI